jgi:DNA processing protein
MAENHYDSTVITLALVKYTGVSPRIFDILLRQFGTVEKIILAESSELSVIDGLSKKVVDNISTIGRKLKNALDYKRELDQREINITTRFDSAYPGRLFEINDPPPLFYSRGKLPENDKKILAVTGAEISTQEGIALTTKLTAELIAKNIQVISSLTPGIDSAVHIGSKGVGGFSFAVLDYGFDKITGEAEIPLAIDVVQTGGVISEYSPDEGFSDKNFQQSNRLIAGMSQAVVVTEFYQDSRRALDMLEYCNQMGKLSFILIDPSHGALSDESSLAKAIEWGAIPMSGLDKIDQIIKSLV